MSAEAANSGRGELAVTGGPCYPSRPQSRTVIGCAACRCIPGKNLARHQPAGETAGAQGGAYPFDRRPVRPARPRHDSLPRRRVSGRLRRERPESWNICRHRRQSRRSSPELRRNGQEQCHACIPEGINVTLARLGKQGGIWTGQRQGCGSSFGRRQHRHRINWCRRFLDYPPGPSLAAPKRQASRVPTTHRHLAGRGGRRCSAGINRICRQTWRADLRQDHCVRGSRRDRGLGRGQ